VARRALAAVPLAAPLYARVDLIRDRGGAPLLLELELIEPSLFFVHAPVPPRVLPTASGVSCPQRRYRYNP
jgi:hypothetical protein